MSRLGTMMSHVSRFNVIVRNDGPNTSSNACVDPNLKQNEAESACAESTDKGSKDVTQTQQERPE